ncbi:acyl-CoA dehydrogenase family protein [Streptomyces sp. NPDC059524]|uniref:acyl-CoA dehydrogenase family protein n=1 Tax=Streptomyces sp. NPDC059524 TaxID=3346856 RepID=UPI00369957C7
MIKWSTEQQALRDGLAPYLDELNSGHVERDAAAAFPHDKWKLLAGTGLLGLPFEERHGGLGQSLLTTMYVLEGLGEGCRDAGLNFSVCTHLASTGVPLQRFGSPGLKERYLPALCSGGGGGPPPRRPHPQAGGSRGGLAPARAGAPHRLRTAPCSTRR